MLGFMKKTKHMRHKNESDGGIYLSELNSDDPEMTALYFPSAHRQSTSGGMIGLLHFFIIKPLIFLIIPFQIHY